jgi:hypothetical protein
LEQSGKSDRWIHAIIRGGRQALIALQLANTTPSLGEE